VANLPLRPLVAKVFQQFPGDFGATGKISFVAQMYILLNAKKRFSGNSRKIQLYYNCTSC
jgi:hypothetical protein